MSALTVEQALGLLPEGDDIHTFRGSFPCLIGADWSRDSIEKAIRESDVRLLAGPTAASMKHGLAINAGDRALFVATDPENLAALEITLANVTEAALKVGTGAALADARANLSEHDELLLLKQFLAENGYEDAAEDFVCNWLEETA